jgi:hypothetical protein
MTSDRRDGAAAPRVGFQVDMNDEYAVQLWCKAFECTPSELKDAVKKVGKSAAAVEVYLQRRF